MGAAREAGLYGVPAVASSFTSFDPEGMERAVEATLEVVERASRVLPLRAGNLGRPNGQLDTGYFSAWPKPETDDRWLEDPESALLAAFSNGDLMLNINAPGTWDGTWATTRLGVRWYRNAVRFDVEDTTATATFTIGAASVDHSPVLAGDCDAVEEDKASLSCLAVWPQSHPFALDEDLLAHGLESTIDGWPRWILEIEFHALVQQKVDHANGHVALSHWSPSERRTTLSVATSPSGWSSLSTKFTVLLLAFPHSTALLLASTNEAPPHREAPWSILPLLQCEVQSSTAVADACCNGLPMPDWWERGGDDLADGSCYRTLICMQAFERFSIKFDAARRTGSTQKMQHHHAVFVDHDWSSSRP